MKQNFQTSSSNNKTTTGYWGYRELNESELELVSGGNENDGAEGVAGHGYDGYGGGGSAFGGSELGTVTVTEAYCTDIALGAGTSAALTARGLAMLVTPSPFKSAVGTIAAAIAGPLSAKKALADCMAMVKNSQ